MNIILCGYHWTGCKALKLLLAGKHNVFVFTHKAADGIYDLAKLCRKYKVDYSFDKISVSNMPFVPDAAVSIYYRDIIKKDVIEYCKGKIFNLHPSLLPKYRGCSSVTWALINGESEYGYTYHYLDEGIDTGNILIQKKLPIEEWDTQLDLYERVMNESMKQFDNALSLVVEGFEGDEQKHEEASYYKRGCPYNGEINPNWEPEKIERFIRAMYFPPYPPATYKGRQIKTLEQYTSIEGSTI